jgi:hypothetical protein
MVTLHYTNMLSFRTALHHNFSIDYVTQIEQWFTYVKPKVHYKSSNTLAASFIGINDVSDTSKWTNVSFPVFFDGLISSVFDGLVSVHALLSGLVSYLPSNLCCHRNVFTQLESNRSWSSTSHLLTELLVEVASLLWLPILKLTIRSCPTTPLPSPRTTQILMSSTWIPTQY